MSEPTFYLHSKAKVPRLYKEAAKIVKEVNYGGSFKGLLARIKHRKSSSVGSLVTETLRNEPTLVKLLQQTGILEKEPRLDPWVTRVLMIELLWNNKALAGPAKPLEIVRSYKSKFHSTGLETKSVSVGHGPRFVRVNTLKTSKQEIIEYFLQEGWIELKYKNLDAGKDNNYAKYLETISCLSEGEFLQDAHVPNLLVFPKSLKFNNLNYYKDNSLLLQDKASCMPALLLNATPGSIVLDMCAAPGMKTTHVAATLNNIGTVYAIERDESRFTTLQELVTYAGASCVHPIKGDALRYSDKEIPDVEFILVDPSCTGSGMKVRRDIFSEPGKEDEERLLYLTSFQCRILEHAMVNFPNVKRIVYSTCSVYPEENEAVVETTLKMAPPNFRPVIPTKGVEWMTPGSSEYKHGNFGFYAKSDVDLTNGFFVIVFERTEHDYVPGKMIQESLQGKVVKTRKHVKEKGLKKEDPTVYEKAPDSESVDRGKREKKGVWPHEDIVQSENFSKETAVCENKERKKKKKVKLDENVAQSEKSCEETTVCESVKRDTKKKKKRKLDKSLSES